MAGYNAEFIQISPCFGFDLLLLSALYWHFLRGQDMGVTTALWRYAVGMAAREFNFSFAFSFTQYEKEL
jgi:hypothetical protein